MNSSNPRFHANISITEYPLFEGQDFYMWIVGNKVIQSWTHNTICRRIFILPAVLEVLCLALPESPASLIIGPTLLWGWRPGWEFYTSFLVSTCLEVRHMTEWGHSWSWNWHSCTEWLRRGREWTTHCQHRRASQSPHEHPSLLMVFAAINPFPKTTKKTD
jgi:hypothetical protein